MMTGQKIFSGIMGLILVLRGLAGFLVHGSYLGLSASMNHNFLHILVGMCLIWTSHWATRTGARGWNKFVGWLYLIIGVLGVLDIGWMAGSGTNTIGDDIFNFFVATTSLIAGYYGDNAKKKAKNWMRALNWPFGQT